MAIGREPDVGHIAELIKKFCVYAKYTMLVAMASGYKYIYYITCTVYSV